LHTNTLGVGLGYMTNRKIVFRAWYKDEMYEAEDVWNFGVDNEFGYQFGDAEEFGVNKDEVVLMQYTGLDDKNGVPIYEGDVILAPQENVDPDYKVTVVEFDDGAYVLNHKNSNVILQRWLLSHMEMEVIGNIHQNPELIK